MHVRYVILDCYVDEPACFGVPPFMSPYPRYVYGALVDAGTPREEIACLTIDHLRGNDFRLPVGCDHVFLIGGAVVPGKYLGHKIGTRAEVQKILAANPAARFSVGGLIRAAIDFSSLRNAAPVLRDIEKYAHGLALGEARDADRTYDELRRWAPLGAPAAAMHPSFPAIICEIESYRGCPRLSHCSFCSEGLSAGVSFRGQDDILGEIDALIGAGVSRFRIGRQADILQYGTEFSDFRNGFPRPSTDAVGSLFAELRRRREQGKIILLNVDNANPGTIASFPEESGEILGHIASAVTPGDTLALGVESFDPEVVKRNNLKVSEEGLMEAVRIINRAGARRVDGIPVILPGINLIHGLAGESKDTFRMNYEALLRILEEGLLLKRINIRKILPYPGTPACERYREPSAAVHNRYEYYKEKIRSEIDHRMLKLVYPAGTVLKGLVVEERHHENALAKQIASYAITARLPLPLAPGTRIDGLVVGHRERSVLALPLPVTINELPAPALEAIPGVGRKAVSRLVLARPFSSLEEVRAAAPDIPGFLLDRMVL